MSVIAREPTGRNRLLVKVNTEQCHLVSNIRDASFFMFASKVDQMSNSNM